MICTTCELTEVSPGSECSWCGRIAPEKEQLTLTYHTKKEGEPWVHHTEQVVYDPVPGITYMPKQTMKAPTGDEIEVTSAVSFQNDRDNMKCVFPSSEPPQPETINAMHDCPHKEKDKWHLHDTGTTTFWHRCRGQSHYVWNEKSTP